MYLIFIDTFRKMTIILLSLHDDFTFKRDQKNVITRVHILLDFFHTRIFLLRNWFEAETSRDCVGYDHPPPEEVSRG